ncbi:MAG: tetratricopeptide repeat protein [Nitrospirae bacterium]|nr:tetratricopeptide repeat protein [Nitrospirota bacterium]
MISELFRDIFPDGKEKGLQGMTVKQKTLPLFAVFIAVLACLVFIPALGNEFVNWDDDKNVYDNTFIRAFDARLFTSAFLDYPVDYWRPLAWISHAVDFAIWGLDPFGHHLTSIILHGINTLLVVLLMIRLLEAGRSAPTGSGLSDRMMLAAAGTTGLLFGLHPLHVESVVWISERKDLLCALFVLLSIMEYTKYITSRWSAVARQRTDGRHQRTEDGAKDTAKDTAGQGTIVTNKHYFSALGLFALALMSKPMAVTLPVMLLVLDWYPYRRIWSMKTALAVSIEKLPFFALSFFTSVLAVSAQQTVGAMRTLEYAPFLTRILVAAQSLILYLWKMVFPLHLVPFYPYPRAVSFLSLEYFAPLVIVSAITIFCLVLEQKQPLWMSLWMYYIVSLLPVLGIIQVGSQSMADRYTYLPSLGPFLALGIGSVWVSDKTASLTQRRLSAGMIHGAVAVCVVVSLSYLTIQQIGIWQDSGRLWNYVIAKTPSPPAVAYYNRALVFQKEGRLDEAIADFSRVIALSPSDAKAYYEQGRIYDDTGELDKAAANYDKALDLLPTYLDALIGRGVLFGKVGAYGDAIERFSRAIAIDPQNAESYNNRGLSFFLTGQMERAREDFSRAIALDGNNPTIYMNRGRLNLRMGHAGLARLDFQHACALGYSDGCVQARALNSDSDKVR